MRVRWAASVPTSRHTSKNASPIFLFAAPKYSSTIPCTISAIWLTKTMTLSWRIWVQSAKSWISQYPKIQSTMRPGIMALTPAVSLPFIFSPIISAPASPNPKARRPPILMMVFSRITVSMGSCFFLLFQNFVHHLSSCSFSRRRAACSSLYAPSPSLMAAMGESRITNSFLLIRSIGFRTRSLAPVVKDTVAPASRIQMKRVCPTLSKASNAVYARLSK
mmetsp:Transcript_2480/g.5671  ORF Transcript_2480/g.5671 Transcript_2480/m.5671 type:complete len:220 (-) Transcript_2480:529-1188(-)